MVGIELPVLAMEHHVPADRGHARGRGPRREDRPARCRWRSTSPARSTSARKAARCSSARTSRHACRGRRARRRGTSGRSCSSPTSTGSRLSCPSRSSTTRRWARSASARSSTARSRSRPTAIRWSGPIRGLRGYWVACGVMAGLSQGGGVGLALATWMTAGDHGDFGHGYLGDGRRPLRRLRDARLHERQGPGELPAAIPDHLPERGAAGRAAAADDADPRPA